MRDPYCFKCDTKVAMRRVQVDPWGAVLFECQTCRRLPVAVPIGPGGRYWRVFYGVANRRLA